MYHLLGLGHNGVEVRLVLKTLSIDLVDMLRTGWPGCKPTASGHDFEAADGGVVPRGTGQSGSDRLASQGRGLDGLRRQLGQARLLCGRCRGVEARVVRRAELRRQFAVVLARVLLRASSNLGRQQVHDRTVLVGRPHAAIVSQKACAGTLLTAEAA